MTPHKLEVYSFWWSEARLVIAAIALLLNGIPPIKIILPFSLPIIGVGLILAWLISGAASLYLIYRWLHHKQHLFGGQRPLDTAAFAVMIISGLNLGITGLIGTNIGMQISTNYVVFLITALVYLAAAYHLFMRHKANGHRIF